MNTKQPRICHSASSLAIVPACLAFLLAGCTGLQGSQEISLQNMRIYGPVTESPVRVTDHAAAGDVHFTPGVTVYRRAPMEGRVALNANDNVYNDSVTTNNFRWETPNFSAGLDGEVLMSRHAAFTAGVRVSSIASRSYTSWTVGFGFFREDTLHAIRLDIGIHRNNYVYDGLTLVNQDLNGAKSSTTFHDIGESHQIGTYFELTYNTRAEEWPVNFFLNAGFSYQPLVDYTPHTSMYPINFTVTDRRASLSQWLLTVAPGLYVRLIPGTRMLVGAKLIDAMDVQNQSPGLVVLPFAQFDIGF